jgi:uncharacterized repeat protein (TIGR01451 family)
MKNLFLTAVSLFISAAAFCQDIVINVVPDDSMGCVKPVWFLITNNSGTDDTGIMTIDWGDGSNDQEIYTVAANSQTNGVPLYHSYAVGGNYIIDVQAVSDFIGVTISIPQGNQLISALGSNNCGHAFFAVNLDNGLCTPNFTNNVHLDFTDNLGGIVTISGSGYVYTGLNPSNAPYTVNINDAWLTANNLTQTSADIIISGFATDGLAITSNQYFIVDWVNNNVSADPSFIYGGAWNFVAPLQTGMLHTNFYNLTCVAMTSNMSVSLTMPALFIPITSGLLNASVSGNVLTFDVLPFIGYQGIEIPFTFPGATPAGTDFCFDVAITYAGDANTTNNLGQICGVVLNSYDPNDKQVNLAERLNPDAKEKLVYKVQFQNDGNFNAVNVNITDIIDADLDLSTLRVLESSHPQSTSVNAATRQVDFTFNNIFLGASSVDLAASQGYIVFEIEENDNLVVGTEIENTANIYFDFNPAIITNTTYNINEYALGINEVEKVTIQFYPNPAKENITFKGADVQEINIFDLSGKLVMSSDEIVNNTISLSDLSNGLYTATVKTSLGNSTTKLSIQH